MSTTENKNPNPFVVNYTHTPATGSSARGVPVLIFDSGYQLTNVNLWGGAIGSTSANVMIGKASGSTPATSATPLLTAVVDIGATQGNVNLPVTASLIGSAALCTFAATDRLCIVPAGYLATPCSINYTFTLVKV
jgi:hypothetical protein